MTTKFKINNEEYIREDELVEAEVNLEYEDVLKIEKINTNNLDEDINIIRSMDGTYKFIFKVEPIDLLSLNKEERYTLLDDYNDSLKSFSSKLKLITINNKYNFSLQKRKLEKRMKSAQNENLQTEIRREIGKLNKFENAEQISFYFMIFGDTKKEILNNIQNFKNTFSTRYFAIRELRYEDVLKIIKKLNNLGG